jgi:D-alanyl-D-alanine dipeptidase
MKYYIIFCLLLLLTSCFPSPHSETGNAAGEADSTGITETRDTMLENAGVEEGYPLSGTPPVYDYDTSEWADIKHLDPGIRLEIRYATDSNFVGEKLYACGRCFLRPEVARAVVRAHRELQERGLGLKMFDCYRPLSVQWRLWEKISTPGYVADPRKGSVHNRGGAVDLTIVNAKGKALDMGTPFDYFGQKAYHTYQQLPDSVRYHRQILKDLMEAYGFRSIRTEWWHFSYTKERYPISEMVWECPE